MTSRDTSSAITHAVLGEAIIDLIVEGDGSYRPHLGGSPYNVAIGLARQDIGVSYLSPVSTDRLGDKIARSLLAENVHPGLRERSNLPTSLALITVDADGSPSYQLYREGVADKDWQVEDIVAALPDELQLFHTGSLAITPSQLPGIRELIAHLRQRDILISIDLNIRLGASKNTQAYLSGVRSLLPACDIVKASDEDVDALALGLSARRTAKCLHDEMGGGLFVLTCGSEGAVVFSEPEPIEVTAHKVERPVDTVGAGDTFQAAFLAVLQREGINKNTLATASRDTLRHAAQYACTAAGINVGRAGCQPPTHIEVEQRLAAIRN